MERQQFRVGENGQFFAQIRDFEARTGSHVVHGHPPSYHPDASVEETEESRAAE